MSDFYIRLVSEAFGTEIDASHEIHAEASVSDGDTELIVRLSESSTVDRGLVNLLEDQTDSYRALDRQLGAARLLQQTELHVKQIADLMAYSLPGGIRTGLAVALAEAAALAGWQALDLGRPAAAWRLHETAKAAANEAGCAPVLAHVSAQQAYVLLDLGRCKEAAGLIRRCRQDAGTRIPGLLVAWLWTAEAEALAAAGGDDGRVRRALDEASRLINAHHGGPGLPYLFLDDVHFGRWRGHCLARLGSADAVDELTRWLAKLDPSFQRATAALHGDLALAHMARGNHEEALAAALSARTLATSTSSVRQRRRISDLIAANGAVGR